MAIRPELWDGWLDRGLVLDRMGRRDEALDSVERALETVPEADRARVEPALREGR